MARLGQPRRIPWAANGLEATCVLFVSLKGKFVSYVHNVSLLCPFYVLEHVVSVLGKGRVRRLTEYSKTTAGHA